MPKTIRSTAHLGVLCLIIFLTASCSGETAASPQTSCYPAPASFMSGGQELRFPKPSGPRGGPLCYDIVLGAGWTPHIYAPLENRSGNYLINLITPGEIEVAVRDGYKVHGWSETAESLRQTRYKDLNLREKCAIFRLRGTGTARVMVDRYERMEPGGIERSTHCPGMY